MGTLKKLTDWVLARDTKPVRPQVRVILTDGRVVRPSLIQIPTKNGTQEWMAYGPTSILPFGEPTLLSDYMPAGCSVGLALTQHTDGSYTFSPVPADIAERISVEPK